MKQMIAASLLGAMLLISPIVHAEGQTVDTVTVAVTQANDYVIDTEGMHAFIQFRIKHLSYSWLYGRFNDFSGKFSYDPAKQESATAEVIIKTDSVDTNQAERDKNLRSETFLDAEKFPEAKFISTKYIPVVDGKGKLEGELTLRDITKPLTIEVEETGAGDDPWGGYRRGFTGVTTFTLKDFGIEQDLGVAAQEVEMILSVEGVRQ